MKTKSHEKQLLISCGILRPEIETLIARGDIDVDAIFLNKYLHMDYGKLHDALKSCLHRHRGKSPVVVYGDVCLGFKSEMQTLLSEFDAVKIDALNCIDALLGGRGQLLEIDPKHRFFFLTPAFIEFSETLISGTKAENRHRFNMLEGIILVDSLGDMERHQDRIDHFSDQTGLPVMEHRKVGLHGLKNLIAEALPRRRP
jgi:hypothetical protein